MAKASDLLNGNPIISSGVIIAKVGDTIELHPFPDDAFPVEFKIKIEDNTEDETEVIIDKSRKKAIVQLKRPWDEGNVVCNAGGIVIGQTTKKKYKFNFIVDFYGEQDDYYFQLMYCVYEEPK